MAKTVSAPKKATTQDRLALLRAKLENTDMETGGNRKGFWSAKEGKTTIRILPEVGEMQYFFQEVGKHTFGPNGEKRVYCPKFTSGGQLECPVCDLVDDLYKARDASSKKLAGKLRNRRSFWMNIIVRGDAKKGTVDTGPFIFTPGVKVMGYISQIIGDPDYGDVTDLYDGFDLVLDRKGTGMDTEYSVLSRRNPSVANGDDGQLQEWVDACTDLTYVELTDDKDEDKELIGDHPLYLLPASRIEEEFDLSDSDALMEALEGDDEDEDEAPKKATVKSTTVVASKKKELVVEDEDEDEPVAETRRRIARRSTR